MEATEDWIKQESAIPVWVANKARSVLEHRMSSIELPKLSATRITALSQDGDAESDAGLPGIYFLSEGDRSAVRRLSVRALSSDIRTWPFLFTPSGTSNFSPTANDRAWTIIALQLVNYNNGLPALGAAEKRTQLSPGDALHFRGTVEQAYGENGGGLCIMIEWKYY